MNAVDGFGRTTSGMANKGLFVGQVIIYVEGEDDVSFFSPLKRVLGCRIESANGKPGLLKLLERVDEEANDFIIVMDDDFDVILNKAVTSRYVVYVGRYSIENLLLCDSLLKEFVGEYCGCDDAVPDEVLLSRVWEDSGGRLAHVAAIDLAAAAAGTDRGGVPERIEMWLQIAGRRISVRDDAWEQFNAYAKGIAEEYVNNATQLLHELSHESICQNYLRGHLVFGLLRNRIFAAIKSVRNSNANIDNRALLRLLSDLFWRTESDRAKALSERLAAAKSLAQASIAA